MKSTFFLLVALPLFALTIRDGVVCNDARCFDGYGFNGALTKTLLGIDNNESTPARTNPIITLSVTHHCNMLTQTCQNAGVLDGNLSQRLFLFSENPLLEYEWSWKSMTQKGTSDAIEESKRYQIIFQKGQKVLIKADCNTLTGEYRLNGNALTLLPLSSTAKICPPNSKDRTFIKAINRIDRLFFRGDMRQIPSLVGQIDNESFMEFGRE